MKYKGIIFDFNGTLFWDSDKHVDAWRFYSKQLRGFPMSDEEMERIVFGRTNKSIVQYLIGTEADEETLEKIIWDKEKVYRDMCNDDLENLKLAAGAESFLDFIVKNGIPHTIATGSDKVNVDYFIETFKLEKWFDSENIVLDNGQIPGKPEPDIYIIAAEKIGLKPEECIVVEDSLSGIESAYRAKIGKIIAIGPEDKHQDLQKVPGVDFIISNFDEIDRNIFDY